MVTIFFLNLSYRDNPSLTKGCCRLIFVTTGDKRPSTLAAHLVSNNIPRPKDFLGEGYDNNPPERMENGTLTLPGVQLGKE